MSSSDFAAVAMMAGAAVYGFTVAAFMWLTREKLSAARELATREALRGSLSWSLPLGAASGAVIATAIALALWLSPPAATLDGGRWQAPVMAFVALTVLNVVAFVVVGAAQALGGRGPESRSARSDCE